MSNSYKTALIGLGKMGVQNTKNNKISKHYQYSSHIEVLNNHPDFDCGALYDLDDTIDGQQFASLEQISEEYKPSVIVLATPPNGRIDIIKTFSGLKAIVMEKPLSQNLTQAQEIIDFCSYNNILLQVNYWRRFDQTIIDLKNKLGEVIGIPQVIFMTYGNGMRNNAVHLIDLIRYLFGEISDAKALSIPQRSNIFPINGDVNIDFQLTLFNGGQVYAHALNFKHYREVGLDIWGSKGRVEFLQGGLVMRQSSINCHRALENDKEILSDKPIISTTGAGEALYGLYDNLAKNLNNETSLLSDGKSALENERILDKIIL